MVAIIASALNILMASFLFAIIFLNALTRSLTRCFDSRTYHQCMIFNEKKGKVTILDSWIRCTAPSTQHPPLRADVRVSVASHCICSESAGLL